MDQRARDTWTADSPLRPGDKLGERYSLIAPLGEGATARVWVGEDTALGRKVALKILRLPIDALRARFQREARALASLRHDGIVQIYDLGQTPSEDPFLVLEYVEGRSLADHLTRRPNVPVRDAVVLAIRLFDALAVAHALGVVHRDIKPENVLLPLAADGQPQLTKGKLADFGIAAAPTPTDQQLTADGAILGTPQYMSPEQVRGAALDGRTDVWSTMVLLYEMIAGKPPFTARDPYELMTRVLRDAVPFPNRVAEMDGKLWRVITQGLQKDLQARFASAVAARDALSGWLSDAGTTSTLTAVPSPVPATLRAATPPPPAAEDAPPSLDDLIRKKLGGR